MALLLKTFLFSLRPQPSLTVTTGSQNSQVFSLRKLLRGICLSSCMSKIQHKSKIVWLYGCRFLLLEKWKVDLKAPSLRLSVVLHKSFNFVWKYSYSLRPIYCCPILYLSAHIHNIYVCVYMYIYLFFILKRSNVYMLKT